MDGANQDPFEDLLNLEERYYAQGFSQGLDDGLRQSNVESRLFGIEKGFEKFLVMGQLQARAKLLAARMPEQSRSEPGSQNAPPEEAKSKDDFFPELKESERLRKHIDVLSRLVDPKSLSYRNLDDDVSDFDDRLKRAHAKLKIIQRIIGDATVEPRATVQSGTEGGSKSGQPLQPVRRADVDMESFGL